MHTVHTTACFSVILSRTVVGCRSSEGALVKNEIRERTTKQVENIVCVCSLTGHFASNRTLCSLLSREEKTEDVPLLQVGKTPH